MASCRPRRYRGYRGGYLPRERREIEKQLREGEILGVVATNALELGIDIGSLDAVVMAGYPGTVASTWQRAGRAGRRHSLSITVLVASSAPLDQYIVEHPDYFFDASPEHAQVNADNVEILISHLKCAAFELPIQDGETFGPHATEEPCQFLEEIGLLHHAGNSWHWTSESYPADAVSLRTVTSDNFVVVDTTGEPRVIGEVDFTAALTTLHEKAIYLHEGKLYHVDRFDYEERKAYVRSVECNYYTDAIDYTRVKILSTFDSETLGSVGSSPRRTQSWRGQDQSADRRLQKTEVLHQRERRRGQASDARAGDAHHGRLAAFPRGVSGPAIRIQPD